MTGAGLKLTVLSLGVVGAGALLWALASGPDDAAASGDQSKVVAGLTDPTAETEADPEPVSPPVSAVAKLATGVGVPLDPRDGGDEEDEAVEPVREGDVYAELMALDKSQGHAALVIEVERILGGQRPRAEKVAALRAVRDVGSGEATRLYLGALTLPAEPGDRHGVSVPTWVLRDLDQRSPRDPAARSALLAVAMGDVQVADPRLRRRAASRMAEVGSSEDLLQLSATVRADDDPLLLMGIAVGLSRNPRGAELAPAFSGLLPPVVADSEAEEDGL